MTKRKPSVADESTVTFTNKEMLQKVDTKLEKIDVRLEKILDELKGKADLALVVGLAAKVDKLEADTKADRVASDTLTNYKRWLIGIAIAFVGSIGGLIFTIIKYAKG